MGNFLCILSGCILYGVCIIYENIPAFCRSGILHVQIARMADVLFVTGAVYFVVKASGKLFPKEKYSKEVRWLFAALAGFMPQAIFMGTYVNTDSLALLAAAMILYAWASYLTEDWTWKNCILLAVGMAVCALSYYNAYGWILCSFFFFCFTVLLCREEAFSQRVSFPFQQRSSDRSSYFSSLRLVVHPQRSFV